VTSGNQVGCRFFSCAASFRFKLKAWKQQQAPGHQAKKEGTYGESRAVKAITIICGQFKKTLNLKQKITQYYFTHTQLS